MYYCFHCQNTFDNPEIATDYVTNDPYPMGPTILVCPYCGWDESAEAIKCNGCDEYIEGEFIKTCDNQYYCENCYQKLDIWDL